MLLTDDARDASDSSQVSPDARAWRPSVPLRFARGDPRKAAWLRRLSERISRVFETATCTGRRMEMEHQDGRGRFLGTR
jgi:hypothetical protein